MIKHQLYEKMNSEKVIVQNSTPDKTDHAPGIECLALSRLSTRFGLQYISVE